MNDLEVLTGAGERYHNELGYTLGVGGEDGHTRGNGFGAVELHLTARGNGNGCGPAVSGYRHGSGLSGGMQTGGGIGNGSYVYRSHEW